MVRIFEDQNIIHVNNNQTNKIDPVSDIEVINLELILADAQAVKKRLDSLSREIKKGDKLAIEEHTVLSKIDPVLNEGKLACSIDLTEKEIFAVRQLNLLTLKPILYILNKKAGGKNLDEMNDERFAKLLEYIKNLKSDYVIVDAKIEEDLKDMEGAEKEMFRNELVGELGGTTDGIDDLIKKGYEILNLITYFTTGEDETRAWTILKDSTAPVAGQAIHTDFKEKFIRAEVVFWKDLIDSQGYATAREKGLVRTEGKEYIVKDGDVIEFKI